MGDRVLRCRARALAPAKGESAARTAADAPLHFRGRTLLGNRASRRRRRLVTRSERFESPKGRTSEDGDFFFGLRGKVSPRRSCFSRALSPSLRTCKEGYLPKVEAMLPPLPVDTWSHVLTHSGPISLLYSLRGGRAAIEDCAARRLQKAFRSASRLEGREVFVLRKRLLAMKEREFSPVFPATSDYAVARATVHYRACANAHSSGPSEGFWVARYYAFRAGGYPYHCVNIRLPNKQVLLYPRPSR